DRAWSYFREPLTDLRREPWHDGIIERVRDFHVLARLEPFDVLPHSPDVAVVLHGHFDLAAKRRIADRVGIVRHERGVRRLGPAEQLKKRHAVPSTFAQPLDLGVDTRGARVHRFASLRRDEPE